MRLCTDCQKPDAPWFEAEPCSCGIPVHDDDPKPEKHRPDCKAIGHQVILYPVRVATKDLTYDANAEAHLKPVWERKGWKLLKNGPRLYRTKYLCRDCVELEREREHRRLEYERLCKAARGIDDQTYAQVLASQD